MNPKFQNLTLEYKVEFKPRYGYGKPPHEALFQIIDANRTQYQKLIQKALLLKEFIWTIKDSERERERERVCKSSLEQWIFTRIRYHRDLYFAN